MNEKEREHLMSEIHSRIGQPGIVLEWHQVEMRRRYELEWERRNEIERLVHPERLALPALVTVAEPPPAPDPYAEYPEIYKVRKREKERRRQECQEILAALTEQERKDFDKFLTDYGRKMPQTPRALHKTIYSFRSLRTTEEQEADAKFYELHMPRESLWTLEMRAYSRMAYPTLRTPRGRPLSEMPECGLWTGSNKPLHPPAKRIGRPRKEEELPEW